MNIQAMMKQPQVVPYLMKGRFGMEKESQRVTLDGTLAKTSHPKTVGCRSYHPYIQTDFSETQMELITPVADTLKDMLRYLDAIHDVALRSMPAQEMLWPLSMPPALPESEDEIQIARLERFEDVLYRRYLAREYGKRKQMVSGIHFNFEFADELIGALFEVQNEYETIEDFKTVLYMKVSRNFLRYRWVLTYLFGAAPLSEARYFEGSDYPEEPVRSIRGSKYGYKNNDDVAVSYASLDQYIRDIAEMVDTGKLSEEKEFYAPVRLRGGKKMSELADYGIRYIELRNIDLNPFERLGISEDQLHFIHLFMLYLLWAPEELPADEWVSLGDRLNSQVALERPYDRTSMESEGVEIIKGMQEMAEFMGQGEVSAFLEDYLRIMSHPKETLAGKWLTAVEETGQKAQAVKLGKKFYDQAHDKPYQLAGFRDMELSTQIFMFDAIQAGIQLEVLDETDQFLKLKFGNRTEYVKNANMTSRDNYIVPLIMENKIVTKKVLAKAGFRVPEGEEFSDFREAELAFERFKAKAFVVKPKSTNYGLGITIFKSGATFEDYQAGLKIAFQEDESVLVETFMPGTEYRFFVLDDQVRAVLLRVPANVLGDGKKTVRELVAEKNTDPLRGTNHRSPLEWIQLGELEQLMLKEQGLSPASIPEAGRQVFLRENSNISTGGDSIDFTDEMTESYKQIAVEAVQALGAKICGIDLIIPDYLVPADKKKGGYGIIEANFNPAMHMHIYTYKGQGQRLTKDVLRFLFPEAYEGSACGEA